MYSIPFMVYFMLSKCHQMVFLRLKCQRCLKQRKKNDFIDWKCPMVICSAYLAKSLHCLRFRWLQPALNRYPSQKYHLTLIKLWLNIWFDRVDFYPLCSVNVSWDVKQSPESYRWMNIECREVWKIPDFVRNSKNSCLKKVGRSIKNLLAGEKNCQNPGKSSRLTTQEAQIQPI